MEAIHTFHPDLSAAQTLLYDKYDLHITEFKAEPESAEYAACTFKLNGLKVIFRVSKITPTKTGQFVTIWKRNYEGVTEPFDFTDDFDVIIISSKSGDNFGQFVFTKPVLTQQAVISKGGKSGKRGIRVYPPWNEVTSKQALSSQSWQTKYFITIGKDENNNIELIAKVEV